MTTLGLVIEVGLTAGPKDLRPGGDLGGGHVWTDLTDRLMSFDLSGGRQDQTGQFEPTTITAVLDCSDRMLDPFHAGSLNNIGDGLGLPRCPVRVFTKIGSTRRFRFVGHLGPECWPVDRAPHGASATVRLEAVDRKGYLDQVGLPGSPYAVLTTLLKPDWWLRSLGGEIFAGNGAVVKDWSGHGRDGRVVAPPSTSAMTTPSLVPGDDDPAFMLQGGVALGATGSALEASSTDVTVAVVWQGFPHTSDQNIARQQVFFGATRWDLYCSPTGKIVATVRDGAGVMKAIVVAPPNSDPSSGGRWDDDQPHLLVLRIEGGAGWVRVWADGGTDRVAHTVASVAGVVRVGGGPITARVDEPTVWRRALSMAEVAYLTQEFLQLARPFSGNSLPTRVGLWFDVAGVVTDGFDSVERHAPGAPALGGLRDVPGSVGEALATTAESYLGAVWAKRNGRIRVRTAAALGAPSLAVHYADPVAHLTDEVSPTASPPVVRRSPLVWSGIRSDRIINESAATVETGAGPMVAAWRDDDSADRFGVRRRDWTTDVADYFEAAVLTRADVERWAEPQAEIQSVKIGPVIDAAEALFLATYELEQAVQVTDTPPVGAKWSAVMQIQGERWSWSGGVRWSVELSLAKS